MTIRADEIAGVLPGGDYNVIPYVSNAFAQSDPARLFALATLFGLTPPAVSSASILELGCAAGGNIVPLALRMPRSRILGVDLTPRHVAEGQERIRALGLSNIEIRQGDVTTLDLGRQSFDCIIAHGIYSWVPPAARDAILRIAATRLSEHGVAYVSYNVLPGWHMRSIIRDLMLFHAGTAGEPEHRIAKARWVLERLSNIAHQGNSYGARLREEASQLASVNDAYILGEFLASENAPCYFRDFMAAAERHGLAYLCESEIETCLPEWHGPEVAQLIRTMSANQLLPLEQYVDFLMGRTFRQTLLVRAERAAEIKRELVPERARGLSIAGRLAHDNASPAEGRRVFRSPQGRTLTTSHPLVALAIEGLAEAHPASRTLDEIVSELREAGHVVSPPEEAEILSALFQMVIAGLGKVWSMPMRPGPGSARRPRATALARLDAGAKRATTTNIRHETCLIDAVNGVIIPQLDGTSTRSMLRRKLMQAIVRGQVNMTDQKSGKALQGAALEKAVAEHVELGIARLAEQALLEHAEDPGGGN